MLDKIKFILTKSEKKSLGFLFVSILLLILLEMVSIGIIIPIINLFVNQDKIKESGVLQWFYESFGFQNYNAFLVSLIFAALIIFVLKSLYTILIIYKQRKIICDINVRLTVEILRSYLDGEYSFHLENNSAVLFRNMTTSVSNFAGVFLLAAISVGTETVILAGISVLLIYLYPIQILSLAGFFTIIIISMNIFIKKRVNLHSSQRMRASAQMHKFGLEALQMIKEVKIYNAQNSFTKKYSNATQQAIDSNLKFGVLIILPRHILEAALWVSVFIILLINLTYLHRPFSQLIPMLAVFMLAALRMLPAIHKVYSGVNSIRYYLNSTDIVYQVLKKAEKENLEKLSKRSIVANIGAFQGPQDIHLENVEFQYRTSEFPILKDFNLIIPRCKTIAFVGQTGSGKSTLINILMGILTPTKGNLCYGKTYINKSNLSQYWREVSYVPQDIRVLDDTLATNIALGIPENEIDYEKIKSVIQTCQLEPFVKNLPEGIQTLLGEKGIRLSGGQRQRVAIARALYHNPQILIMDEATSSLDGYTEAELNKAIKNLYGKLTIVIIAHRLSTVRYADVIYVLDQGRIVDKGRFEELSKQSAAFKKIANQLMIEEEDVRDAAQEQI